MGVVVCFLRNLLGLKSGCVWEDGGVVSRVGCREIVFGVLGKVYIFEFVLCIEVICGFCLGGDFESGGGGGV